MARKAVIPVNFVDFPEEITDDGVKIYGETSLENQLAMLSHTIHGDLEITDENRSEIAESIRDFLDRKKDIVSEIPELDGYENWDEERIMILAEDSCHYGRLFDDFHQVPFPPEGNETFTFIDNLAS